MTTFARFRGTFAALVALLAVLGVAGWLELRPDPIPADKVPDTLFRFEKDEMVGFSVHRPDMDLTVHQADGAWIVDGEPWRPSRSMIRRVAHQLHDLDARADVVTDDAADDAERYGVGDRATRVEVSLTDGRTLKFVVGDPNPTSVSHYVRVLTGDGPEQGPIYVVKKSAMDFWRLPMDAFREDRIAVFDADDVASLHAVIDGAPLDIERIGPRKYRMHAPVDQPASRDAVRAMLGRVSALRAQAFVADAPADRSPWGLAPPQHTISVTLGTGEVLAVDLGAVAPGSDPPARYVYLQGDDAVYLVRDGMLDSFRKTADELRDRELVGRHEWDLASMTVTRGGPPLTLRRTSDTWRWPDDDAAVAGSTPKRVASRAAELEAITFREPPPADDGLAAPWATVALAFTDGEAHVVRIGARWKAEGAPSPPLPPAPGEPARVEPPRPREEPRMFASVDDGPVVEADGSLADAIEDLFREYGRKQQRDADKGLPE